MNESTDVLPDDIKAMSFEQALESLRALVSTLERGDAKLRKTASKPMSGVVNCVRIVRRS